jgi:hypothetical protein
MRETSQREKFAIWFISDLIISGGSVFLYEVHDFEAVKQAVAAENQAVANLQATLRTTSANFLSASQQRDACTSKFERMTFLYDVGLFNKEVRAWIIPADVEPIIVGTKQGNFTHYDPRTQVESIHFRGKPE